MGTQVRGISYHLGQFLGWCLFGWRAKSAPVRPATPQRPQAVAYSESVVRAYGHFLETLPGGPLDIRDEAELPYPKWQIALELLGAIKSAPPEMRSALETGLLQLADFQPRIGKTLKAPATRMMEMAQAKNGQSVEELARSISAIADTESDRRYQTVRCYAEAEASWFASLVR